MEVEAWFLAEHSHFARIDPAITLASIIANLNFDPSNDDLQLRPSPASDLHACYALAGKSYEKKTSQLTINALDCASIYLELSEKFPHLVRLCEEISSFLDSDQGVAA
jgi:hypothetical protein